MSESTKLENARTATPPNLADAIVSEQARCREILEHAIEIGPAGSYLAAILRQSLARAERAAVDGDVVLMIQAVTDLRGYSE